MGAGMGVSQILHHMTWRIEDNLFVGIASVRIVWMWMKFAVDGGMKVWFRIDHKVRRKFSM